MSIIAYFSVVEWKAIKRCVLKYAKSNRPSGCKLDLDIKLQTCNPLQYSPYIPTNIKQSLYYYITSERVHSFNTTCSSDCENI